MLKKLVAFGAMLALVASLLVPTTAVFANEENTENAETTNEEVENEQNEQNANDENGENAEEEENNEAATPTETQETNLIYWIVIGYVFVLSVGLYAFTEGTKKD